MSFPKALVEITFVLLVAPLKLIFHLKSRLLITGTFNAISKPDASILPMFSVMVFPGNPTVARMGLSSIRSFVFSCSNQ